MFRWNNALNRFLYRRPTQRRRTAVYRPTVEILEDRTLLNAGVLDPTFGSGGTVTVDLGNGGFSRSLFQNDGKVVVVGEVFTPDVVAGYRYHITLARSNANGTLDTTFGSGGHVTTDFGAGYGESPSAATIQPDGKIVIAGDWIPPTGVSRRLLVRFNADGSLDDGSAADSTPADHFGTGGFVRTNFYGYSLYAVTVQSDGKIVVGGGTDFGFQDFFLARFNADGSLDDGSVADSTPLDQFGMGGIVTTDFGQVDSVRGIVIQPDGKIVATGLSAQILNGLPEIDTTVLARYNADGSLDDGSAADSTPLDQFGSGGKVILPLVGGSSVTVPFARILEDGKILGVAAPDPQDSWGAFARLFRLNQDGSLDDGSAGDSTPLDHFGSGGVASVPGQVLAMSVQPDQKILVAGTSYQDFPVYSGSFFLGRFDADGTPDATFGSNGSITTGVGTSSQGFGPFDTAQAIELQPDGRIVLAGTVEGSDAAAYTVLGLARYWGDNIPPAIAVSIVNSQVTNLVTATVLSSGNGAALTTKLNSATTSLNAGNNTAAVNQLNAFINQVNAFQKTGKLTSAEAQSLISAANLAINAIQGTSARLLDGSAADGSATGDSQPVTDAGQLVSGTIGVYLDNADGTPVSADEQACFDDAIATLDATFGPYGVDLVDVGASDAADAVVQVEISDTSAAGSAADGVLGCTVAGNITLLTGWNWFTGGDASAIGAGQYDFETIVMHELGHSVGLGHSGDAGSVMYPYLASGQARRVVTTQDLSVLESDGGTAPEPLLAAPWRDAQASGGPSLHAAEPQLVQTDAAISAPELAGSGGFGSAGVASGLARSWFFALLGAGELPLGSRQLLGWPGEPSRAGVAVGDTLFSSGMMPNEDFAGRAGSPIFASQSPREEDESWLEAPLFSNPGQDGLLDTVKPSGIRAEPAEWSSDAMATGSEGLDD